MYLSPAAHLRGANRERRLVQALDQV